MYILAFETSCDDTSVALLKDGELVAMSTRTQLEHNVTWGVVPEVAARSHANAIFPCIEDVLLESRIELTDIDYIACTEKPGLLPSLLTGLTVAKTLSLSLSIPLILVHHIESHIFANFLWRSYSDIIFPAVVLTVSWGHTEIYLWKSLFHLEILGQTRDDAAGECFDKVAKMMWLGFPGWAKIAKLAEAYRGLHNQEFFSKRNRLFPIVLLEKDSLDFSFSGLKTAVKREIDSRLEKSRLTETQRVELSDEDMMEIAYEVEETIALILSKKLIRAFETTHAKMICLAWWVSANTVLKDKLSLYSAKHNVPFLAPVKTLYSMDNAAMVGIRAFYDIQRNSV